ncbi:MAG: hypothetical protein ABIE70_09295 [bacterium]
MLKRIVVIGFLISALGCGGDQSQAPIYDTSANPYGLPSQACSLLDRIEAGQLATFDLITDAFKQLYTDHPELLDNLHWREIIDRLGPRFTARADELVARGIGYYSQAAGFYTLASFAQPENDDARTRQRLFGAWTDGLDNLGATGAARKDMFSLAGAIEVTRQFVLGDSLEQQFAREFLVEDYLGRLIDSLPPGHSVSSLSVHDRAYLNGLNLGPMPNDKPLVEFAEPDLNLLSAAVVPLADGNLRLELCLVAEKPVAADWLPALKGAQPDGGIITISPSTPTSVWTAGQTVLIGQVIKYLDPESGLSLAWISSDAARSSPDPLATEFVTIPGLSLAEIKN